jgi:hypothetical protein
LSDFKDSKNSVLGQYTQFFAENAHNFARLPVAGEINVKSKMKRPYGDAHAY